MREMCLSLYSVHATSNACTSILLEGSFLYLSPLKDVADLRAEGDMPKIAFCEVTKRWIVHLLIGNLSWV